MAFIEKIEIRLCGHDSQSLNHAERAGGRCTGFQRRVSRRLHACIIGWLSVFFLRPSGIFSSPSSISITDNCAVSYLRSGEGR